MSRSAMDNFSLTASPTSSYDWVDSTYTPTVGSMPTQTDRCSLSGVMGAADPDISGTGVRKAL